MGLDYVNLIKRVLLAEAQHRRLHSAFGGVEPNCLVLMMYDPVIMNNINKEEPAEEAEAAAAGEDELLHANTIGDCELLLIILYYLTQDLRILKTPVYRDPHMARHQIPLQFVRSTR